MNISVDGIRNTKFIAPKGHANACQRVLLKNGFGYELNMSKSFIPRKFPMKSEVAFFIDFEGYIEFVINEKCEEYTSVDFDREFYGASEQEIDYSALF